MAAAIVVTTMAEPTRSHSRLTEDLEPTNDPLPSEKPDRMKQEEIVRGTPWTVKDFKAVKKADDEKPEHLRSPVVAKYAKRLKKKG